MQQRGNNGELNQDRIENPSQPGQTENLYGIHSRRIIQNPPNPENIYGGRSQYPQADQEHMKISNADYISEAQNNYQQSISK